MDKPAFNHTIFSSHILSFKADKNDWWDTALECSGNTLKLQLCKVKTMPRSPFKTEKSLERLLGGNFKGLSCIPVSYLRKESCGGCGNRDQAGSNGSVHSPLRSPAEHVAPDAFSECLDTGMAYAFHGLAASPPTAFDLSCKDTGLAKYLKLVAHLLQEGR